MIDFSLLAPYLYYWLAPALIVYWVVLKPQQRPFFITLISCSLLFAAAPAFFVYVVCSAFLISRFDYTSSGKRMMTLAFIFGAVTILCWKYIIQFFDDVATQFSSFGILFATIGVSYMGLRITALIISLKNQEIKDVSFLDCLNFLSFFPTIAAGPLENITGFHKGYSKEFDPQLFWSSIYRLAIGLFKKLIIIEIFFRSFFHKGLLQFVLVDGVDASAYTSGEIFILCMLLFLKALLDISAYTDLALGFAGLFGYRIINDLRYPLISRDLSEFWRSWHISVMRWVQTHIYFPVFFWRKSITLGTFAGLTVMGVWHNAELKWLLWGLYQALGLTLLHKWNQFKSSRNYPSSIVMKRFHRVFGTVLTFIFATFAFLIMGPENFSRSYDLLRAFLGI